MTTADLHMLTGAYALHALSDHESEEFAQEFEAHVQNSREGAPGRGSAVGGGCGCN